MGTRVLGRVPGIFHPMAGLAANTQSIGIIPTVTLLSQHPAYVARMIATLDDMSGADAA